MAKNKNNGDLQLNAGVSKKLNEGFKYLDSVLDEDLNSNDYIPSHVFPSLSDFVRGIRKTHDYLTEQLDSLDKGSEQYDSISRQREELAKALITAKAQITALNKGTLDMKNSMSSLSKGTQASHLYNNTVVYAGQSDNITFDEKGKIVMGYKSGNGNGVTKVALDNMKGAQLITEPMGSKAFVWKLAEKTKQESISNKGFDKDWTYTRVYNNLTEGGPQNSIGMAFTDMAGDNQTKSFAEMWDEGLNDQEYYINPETDEKLKGIDSNWMKDPANADMLKKFLGQLTKTRSQLAQDLIKKYSHASHDHK